MEIEYSLIDLAFYFYVYAFLGWTIQVAGIVLKDRHFINKGLLNLPFTIPDGITAVILLLVLPTLEGQLLIQFLVSWIIMEIAHRFGAQFVRNVSHRNAMPGDKKRSLTSGEGLLMSAAQALVYLLVYLLIHPFVFVFTTWLPDFIVIAAVIVLSVMMAADYIGVHHALRMKILVRATDGQKKRTQRMAEWMSERIWNRLEKAYPGVERLEPENQNQYTFAKGICFDKLVWVLLISSFIGALIETAYCYFVHGQLMNRSGVLYGTFSFVWGFGAVVLTVVLQRLARKEDRWIFFAGFVIGGTYEYLCSVIFELVLGTVFWDYSDMPLNIGGRTNVLFCIFWGILSVVWIKVLYPPMSRGIEKIPPLAGKILTWVIIFFMLCDGLLTASAMARYSERQTRPEPSNGIEVFLDSRYDDAWMEQRWPNMKFLE